MDNKSDKEEISRLKSVLARLSKQSKEISQDIEIAEKYLKELGEE